MVQGYIRYLRYSAFYNNPSKKNKILGELVEACSRLRRLLSSVSHYPACLLNGDNYPKKTYLELRLSTLT